MRKPEKAHLLCRVALYGVPSSLLGIPIIIILSDLSLRSGENTAIMASSCLCVRDGADGPDVSGVSVAPAACAAAAVALRGNIIVVVLSLSRDLL